MNKLYRFRVSPLVLILSGVAILFGVGFTTLRSLGPFDDAIQRNAADSLEQGRQTFRFDTFGDEVFWGDALQLHQAIQGEMFGGVGPGVSPNTALAVGLRVDVDALPRSLQNRLRRGQVDLDDPATTLALLRLNAVVGVTGFFNEDGSLALVRHPVRPVPFYGG